MKSVPTIVAIFGVAAAFTVGETISNRLYYDRKSQSLMNQEGSVLMYGQPTYYTRTPYEGVGYTIQKQKEQMRGGPSPAFLTEMLMNLTQYVKDAPSRALDQLR